MEKTEKFVFEEHLCTLICPNTPAKGNPWVWRAEFLGAFDTVDQALLERGWHIAYCRLHDLYGCDEAITEMKKFHDMLVKDFGLSEKADLFGFSRGGLYAFRYALQYPQDIQTVYFDAPVLNIKSWPGGFGKSNRYIKEWAECLQCYHIEEDQLDAFSGNPIDHLSEFVTLGLPTVLVAGDADDIVPYDENGALLQSAMKAGELDRLVIIKPGCGHHPHSLEDPQRIVAFIVGHLKQTNKD